MSKRARIHIRRHCTHVMGNHVERKGILPQDHGPRNVGFQMALKQHFKYTLVQHVTSPPSSRRTSRTWRYAARGTAGPRSQSRIRGLSRGGGGGGEKPRGGRRANFRRDVCSLTSPLAKARLIGVSSLHSTTHRRPTHTHARVRARARDTHTDARTCTRFPPSLFYPSLAPIFSSANLHLSLSFLHSSGLSLPPPSPLLLLSCTSLIFPAFSRVFLASNVHSCPWSCPTREDPDTRCQERQTNK